MIRSSDMSCHRIRPMPLRRRDGGVRVSLCLQPQGAEAVVRATIARGDFGLDEAVWAKKFIRLPGPLLGAEQRGTPETE